MSVNSTTGTASTDVLDIITGSSIHHQDITSYNYTRSKNSKINDNKNEQEDHRSNVLRGSSLFQLSDAYKLSDQFNRNQTMEKEMNVRMLRRRHSMFIPRTPDDEEEKTIIESLITQDRRKSIAILPLQDERFASDGLKDQLKPINNGLNSSNETDKWILSTKELNNNIITTNHTESRRSSLRPDFKNNLISSIINEDSVANISLSETSIDSNFHQKNSDIYESPNSLEVGEVKTQQRRRSSVTFSNVVEEFNANINKAEAVHCISSIEEDSSKTDKDLDDVYDEEENLALIQQIKLKKRSKSLFPSLEKACGSQSNRKFKLKLEKDLASSSPPLDIRKHSHQHKKHRLSVSLSQDQGPLHPHLNNLRSDSVDSGFSCASISSCTSSSSDSSIEPPKTIPRRSASMACTSPSADSPKTSLGEAIDYPAWVKSVKKLVQLTKELKNISSTEEETEKTMLAEISALRQIEQVKKFVRHNDWPVSHEIRADLWRVLCNSKDFETNKLLYSQQIDDLTKIKTFRPSFLSMDGIVVHDHGLKEQGAVNLQKLLIVIECVRPELRYVPILYPLCAMFLHYMGPEDTFACVLRLLSQGHTFILQSELAVYASCYTLLSLLKKHKVFIDFFNKSILRNRFTIC